MTRLRATVPCVRPAEAATPDDFGNSTGETRAAVTFDAAFVPPTTMSGSQIIDGTLRETTVTKPTLMVEPTTANAPAFIAGAIKSGDSLTVNGESGWQVDGKAADWTNAISGKHHMLVIELRRSDG